MALDLQSTNEEKILITVHPVTRSGNEAKLDGPVRVTVTNGESTFDMESDVAFWVVSSDNPGVTSYLVEGDADLGEGEVLLQESVNYDVGGANATSFGLTAEAPVLK